MNIPQRVETALRILNFWYRNSDIEERLKIPSCKNMYLRWKAIGIVQHDRILNIEPAHPIPMRTMAQVIGK